MSANPLYPDVPFANGVPAVLRQVQASPGSVVNSAENVIIGAAQQAINGQISNVQSAITNGSTSLINGAFGAAPTVMTSDSPSITSTAAAGVHQWGIFDQNNNLLLVPDSFKSIGFKHAWRVADYPMEQGAFQSYNKVQTPFELNVVMVKGGKVNARNTFLTTLETLAESFNLINVVTPDYTYANVTISSYDYQRSATNGVELITFDIKFEEIKVVQAETFSNAAQPSGADAVNTGIVQPIPVTTGSTSSISSLSSALSGGANLAQAISNTEQKATNSLPSSIVSSITSTVTKAVNAQLNQITASVTQVTLIVKAQTPLLLKIT